jgi:hypothetical protein
MSIHDFTSLQCGYDLHAMVGQHLDQGSRAIHCEKLPLFAA